MIIGGAAAVAVAAAAAWFAARRLGLFTGERSVSSTDEDADAFGQRAVVTEKTGGDSIRIHFRGTSWPARVVHGHVEIGAQVRIIDRDNLIWIVEPVHPALTA